MPLLIHAVGESDLLLNSGERDQGLRERWVAGRLQQLDASLRQPDGAAQAAALLSGVGWTDGVEVKQSPGPLLKVLTVLGETVSGIDESSALDILLVGTEQRSSRQLDTAPIARGLGDALKAGAASGTGVQVRSVDTVIASGLCEHHVISAVAGWILRCGLAPDRIGTLARPAMVTWGSGSTALASDAMTALSIAKVPWRLAPHWRTREVAGPDVLADPLRDLGADPVVAVLVRWRLFGCLADLVDKGVVSLEDEQLRQVRGLAEQHQTGIEECQAAEMRVVLSDLLVRRDGTGPMVARRYVVSRYEELFQAEANGAGEELLELMEYPDRPGPTLGVKLKAVRCLAGWDHPVEGNQNRKAWGKLKKNWSPDKANEIVTVVRNSRHLESCQWLAGTAAFAINEIGKGSHRLDPPEAALAETLREHLNSFGTDATQLASVGLPKPPVVSPDVVGVLWCMGTNSNDLVPIAEQLGGGRIPQAVRDYLGTNGVQVRAQIFGTPDGSIGNAEGAGECLRQAAQHRSGQKQDNQFTVRIDPAEVWVDSIAFSGGDPASVEQLIEQRLVGADQRTAALVLIPTGPKSVLLTTLRAVRRVGARHGIPVFVQQTGEAPEGGIGQVEVHLWPALTGGDLPLLIAACNALETLELDVAWRLLAASAAGPVIIDRARWLAMAFASREVNDDTRWTATWARDWLHGAVWRSVGMVAQRINLVRAVLDQATTAAARTRLLVLAADVLEASVAATGPSGNNGRYCLFRDGLETVAKHGTPDGATARILLLLNAARDQASITHGLPREADKVVAEQADRLARVWDLAIPHDLPGDVQGLIEAAGDAALQRGLGQPDQVDDLSHLRDELIALVDTEIADRRARTR